MPSAGIQILLFLLIVHDPGSVAADSSRPADPPHDESTSVADHHGVYVGLWRRFGTSMKNGDALPSPIAVSPAGEMETIPLTPDGTAAPLWPLSGDLTGFIASDSLVDAALPPMESMDTDSGTAEPTDWERAAIRSERSSTGPGSAHPPGATTLVVGLVAVIVMLGVLLMPR